MMKHSVFSRVANRVKGYKWAWPFPCPVSHFQSDEAMRPPMQRIRIKVELATVLLGIRRRRRRSSSWASLLFPKLRESPPDVITWSSVQVAHCVVHCEYWRPLQLGTIDTLQFSCKYRMSVVFAIREPPLWTSPKDETTSCIDTWRRSRQLESSYVK